MTIFRKAFTLAEGTPCSENLTCVARHAFTLAEGTPCSENLTCVARHAFTLAEGTPCFENLTCVKRHAFTLAEVLIVIGVIGVVAAITIPTLIPLIKDKVDTNRKEVIEDRLIQGLNQLNTLDDGMNASQYETTEDFVKALSKHYKMSQICGANNLKDCFPYGTINYTDDNGDATANIEDLKTPEAFKLSSDEYYAPAGFISAQGTPFVMLLKKDCIMDTGKAMRGIPTSCVQYMYDNNGSAIPNKLGKDIEYSKETGMGIASTSGGSKVEPDGTFANPIGEYTTYLFLNYDHTGGTYNGDGLNTCEGQPDHKWDTRTDAENTKCSNNRWAAAKKACSEAGYELPSKELSNDYAYRTASSFSLYDQAFYTVLKNKTGSYTPPTVWASEASASENAWQIGCIGDTFDGPVDEGMPVLCLGK